MSLAELALNCSHLFVDAGANLGEGVDAWYKGSFSRCALHSPNRLYGRAWNNMSAAAKRAYMAPVADPARFCVRSFEANPRLMPALRTKEAALREQGRRVQFVNGMLGNVTGSAVPRTIVTYSQHPSGSSAVTFPFGEIFAHPKPLASEVVTAAAYDVREVIRETLRQAPAAVIAMRLDIEGGEFGMLDMLTRGPEPLLCQISYLFVEYHNLHVNLTRHGFSSDGYFKVGARIHELMNDYPGCRLKINWRNFWSAVSKHAAAATPRTWLLADSHFPTLRDRPPVSQCGDHARYSWMGSEQATGRAPGSTRLPGNKSKSKARRARGRKLRNAGTPALRGH